MRVICKQSRENKQKKIKENMTCEKGGGEKTRKVYDKFPNT